MEKLEIIVKAMSDKFGENIVAIDMSQASPIFDTFILCSASNARIMNAIRDAIEDNMAKEFLKAFGIFQFEEVGFEGDDIAGTIAKKAAKEGYDVKHVEGLRDSKWILMDFDDVIVHIFEQEERRAYNLEKLWADMPTIDIGDYL
mgnify:CR=1 FL=1